MAFLLFRRFWYRLFLKYVLRDFHPLVFFYLLATVTAMPRSGAVRPPGGRDDRQRQRARHDGDGLPFFSITSLNSVFFAMWMDMQANDHLVVRSEVLRRRREPVREHV